MLAHKLIFETLTRKKLRSLAQWLQTNDADDPLNSADDNEAMAARTDRVIREMAEFDTRMAGSTMFTFWNNHMKAVQSLLVVPRQPSIHVTRHACI